MRLFTTVFYTLLAPAAALAAVPLAHDLAPMTVQTEECEYELLVLQSEQDLPKIRVAYVLPTGISLWRDDRKSFTVLPSAGVGSSELLTNARIQYKFKPRDGKAGPCNLSTLQSEFASGALPRFDSIKPSSFDVHARLRHLYGVDLEAKFVKLARFPKPLDDSRDIDIPIDIVLSPSQAAALANESRADGLTDLDFLLLPLEKRLVFTVHPHRALFTIQP
jgi:hypothetical protein